MSRRAGTAGSSPTDVALRCLRSLERRLAAKQARRSARTRGQATTGQAPADLERQRRREADLEAGPAILELISTSYRWVNRRVDSVEFHDDATMVRRVSLDFRLPASAPAEILPDGKVVRLVPLTWIDKQFRLKGFDVHNEGGASLSLLTTSKRIDLLTAGLAELAVIVNDRRPLPKPVLDGLRTMVTAPRDDAEAILARWKLAPPGGLKRRLVDQPAFGLTLGRLVRSTVAIVLVDDRPDQQRVIKYTYQHPFQYGQEALWSVEWERPGDTGRRESSRGPRARRRDIDEPVGPDGREPQEPPASPVPLRRRVLFALGWEPLVVTLPTPAIQDSRSYHLEVTAPPGVEIPGAVLVSKVVPPRRRPSSQPGPTAGPSPSPTALDPDPAPGSAWKYDVDRNGESRAHVLIRDRLWSRGRAGITLLPDRHEVGGVWLAAILTAAVMTAGLIWVTTSFSKEVVATEGHAEKGIGVATLLLVLPAIFATLLVRTSEHAMAHRLLSSLRRQVMLAGVFVFLAAATLVAGPSGESLTRIWWILTVLCLLLAASVTTGSLMKQRTASRQVAAVERALKEKDPLLHVRGVTKRVGPVRALDQVHLRVPPGQVLALVGHAGAGKSTLLGIMCGSLRADHGEVLFEGSSLRSRLGRRTARLGIAALAEDRGLSRHLDTGAGVTDGAPGSPRRRLSTPRLLLLDEPARELLDRLAERLRATGEERRARGQAIVIASRDLAGVFEIADRFAVLRRGQLVEEGERGQITMAELAAAMTEAAADQPDPSPGRAIGGHDEARADVHPPAPGTGTTGRWSRLLRPLGAASGRHGGRRVKAGSEPAMLGVEMQSAEGDRFDPDDRWDDESQSELVRLLQEARKHARDKARGAIPARER